MFMSMVCSMFVPRDGDMYSHGKERNRATDPAGTLPRKGQGHGHGQGRGHGHGLGHR
jgi:hypothetical protein